MITLGIETSCDETAAALVQDGTIILSSEIASSETLHKKTGGIIPEFAAREQIIAMLPVVEETLRKYQPHSEHTSDLFRTIDAIAVTVGPGLIGSLLIGIETAKTLALLTQKPIIPVNHILAHIYANWLTDKEPIFPAIALVVSGGHTELFHMKDHHHIEWLGGTLDDASGEAFDKTARMLDLSYPGGPAIAKLAQKHNSICPTHEKLPRPLLREQIYSFSFSGLKTAVMRLIAREKARHTWTENKQVCVAWEIQEAITDVLVTKTLTAATVKDVQTILLGGGVASNIRLKEKFQEHIFHTKSDFTLLAPPSQLCTDNAACIASYAYFHPEYRDWDTIQPVVNLSVEN